MRPIYTAQLDKRRPVVILTREHAIAALTHIAIAPITSTARGLRTEVTVGPDNGLTQPSVISCDNITTIPKSALENRIGALLDHQEAELATAIHWAFNLAP